MRIASWAMGLVLASWLTGCDEPPAPPPKQVVTRAPTRPPPPKVEVPPPPPELVAAFPDTVVPDDADTDERLLRLLLSDPAKAERILHTKTSPDAWQVAVIAQFALVRGEKTFDVDPEPMLPMPALDGGVVSGPGPAWLAEDAPLLAPRGKQSTLATLPINTKVEVKTLEGEWAQVSVPIAQVAVFAEDDQAPKVTATALLGRVKQTQLVAAPRDAEALMREALAQGDDTAGRLVAVALWHRAWRAERSERTRAGLLRAAWAARHASTLVRTALARNLAPVSGIRFAWACTGDDPAATKWLDVSRARPKPLPGSVCLSGLDARARCVDDSAAARSRAESTQQWLDALALTPKPWLRFTVDARDPRQVFLVTTPLDVADPCSDFEELTFEAASGQVRRLALPLGSRELVVWVPVTRHAGAEFAVPSATSEGLAVAWLRSRGNYRWTLDGRGDLQPSLGTNARTYDVGADVSVTSFALAPERDCSCQ